MPKGVYARYPKNVTEKECCQCKKIKDLGGFGKKKYKSFVGYEPLCKECVRFNAKRWRLENPEKHNQHNKLYRYRQRMKIFRHYCGEEIKCQCCGEKELMFLCIDHKNNDGYQQRKEMLGSKFYTWIITNNYPPIFQILCYNCNMGRRLNGGICPH